MEAIPERDKRKGKAIVEETDQQFLPAKCVPKFNSHVKDDLSYMKLIGSQRIANQPADTDSSAEQVQRKLFRIRNKEVGKILGREDERLKNIHSVSGATIGILSDTPAKIHRHSYLELLGTLDEVKIAELLIVDAITETYERPLVPTALMPTNICHHKMTIPLFKVVPLLGFDGDNILKMEAKSGAWIELDTFHPPPGGKTWQRGVNIYGHGPQVTSAIKMIQGILSEHRESVDSKNDWELLVEEIAAAEEAEHKESLQLKDEKQQHVGEAGSGEQVEHKDSAHSENEMKPCVEKAGSGEEAVLKDSDRSENKTQEHVDEVGSGVEAGNKESVQLGNETQLCAAGEEAARSGNGTQQHVEEADSPQLNPSSII